jgi:predicted secreted protein
MAGLTQEEKVAVKISNLIADLQLDIDMVGVYFANYANEAVYKRFLIMVESAIQSGKEREDRINKIT